MLEARPPAPKSPRLTAREDSRVLYRSHPLARELQPLREVVRIRVDYDAEEGFYVDDRRHRQFLAARTLDQLQELPSQRFEGDGVGVRLWLRS